MLALRTNRPMVPSVFGRDFDRLLDTMFAPGFLGYAPQNAPALFPALNLHETENGFTIEAELPGFTDENIDVNVSGNMLTIRGKRELETADDAKTFHRRERWSGSFERTLRLPAEVEADRVTATLNHGVLTIALPKPEVAQAKRISVKTA